jgi:hypothetical protein
MLSPHTGGLLDQYLLLGAVIDSKWATRLDHKIARVVIDRFFQKHGNSRASLGYLERATGAARSNVIASLRRIAENGAISVARLGAGTRPTEYTLNFEFGAGNRSGRADTTATSGDASTTAAVSQELPLERPSSHASATETYLPSLSTDRLTVSRNDESPAAASPPPARLEPVPAGAAVVPKSDGFEELWLAYPLKVDRSKAKAEYAKLAPDASLHAKLVEAATKLSVHHAANGTEKTFIKRLQNWIREERYEEDLPTTYANAKDAANPRFKAGRTQKTNVDTDKFGPSGLSPKTPLGRHVVEVTSCDVLSGKNNSERFIDVHFRIQGGTHDGKDFAHNFLYMTDDGADEQGSRWFSDVCRAVNNESPRDTSEFLGATLTAIVSKGGIEYKKADAQQGQHRV